MIPEILFKKNYQPNLFKIFHPPDLHLSYFFENE